MPPAIKPLSHRSMASFANRLQRNDRVRTKGKAGVHLQDVKRYEKQRNMVHQRILESLHPLIRPLVGSRNETPNIIPIIRSFSKEQQISISIASKTLQRIIKKELSKLNQWELQTRASKNPMVGDLFGNDLIIVKFRLTDSLQRLRRIN